MDKAERLALVARLTPEALATSIAEQMASTGPMDADLDRYYAELRRGLLAAGWIPGTGVVAWVGCPEDELRQAIEDACGERRSG